MKLLPGISLLVMGSVFLTFSIIAFTVSPPSSLDGRAVLLIASFVAGGAFQGLGVRDLVRAKRLASGISSAT